MEDSAELRKSWNELYQNVLQTVGSTNKNCESEEFLSRGLRPKDKVLNILLDAIAIKFIELEQSAQTVQTNYAYDDSETDFEDDNKSEVTATPELTERTFLTESLMLTEVNTRPTPSSKSKNSSQNPISNKTFNVKEQKEVWIDADVRVYPKLKPSKSRKRKLNLAETLPHNEIDVTNQPKDANIVSLSKRTMERKKSEEKDNCGRKISLQNTEELLQDFDKIPDRAPFEPKFCYKQKTVRGKNERALLTGHVCQDCQEYYAILNSQLDENEIARIINRCSRHRSKVPPVNLNNTPPDFWRTDHPDTEQLYADGYIRVASRSFTPPEPRPAKNSDVESDDDIH